MNNMEISIRVFRAMAIIAKRHGFTQKEWGEAAGIYKERISEFNSALKGGKAAKVLSARQAMALFSGLRKLIGGSELRKEVMEIVDAEPDKKIRALLMTLFIASDDGPELDAVEMYLSALIKSRT